MLATNLSFAELAGLALYPDGREPLVNSVDGLAHVRARLVRENAVLATHEWVQEGRPLDFVVIFGVGLTGYDPSQAITDEVIDFFRAIPSERIFFLPGPSDFAGERGRAPFDVFLKRLCVAIPQKKFYDLSAEAAVIPGFVFAGIDSSRLASAAGSAEVSRLRQVLEANAGATFLFCHEMDLLDSPTGIAGWIQQTEIRQGIASLVAKPWVHAVFGAPGSWPDHKMYAKPYTWWSAGAKGWITVELRGEFETRGGINFVTINSTGAVRAMPRFVAAAPAAEPSAEKWYKLSEGDAFLAAEDFPTAIASFRDALSSTNREVVRIAEKRLQLALETKEASEQPLSLVARWIGHYVSIALLGLAALYVLRHAIWFVIQKFAARFKGDPFQKPWRIAVSSKSLESLPTDLCAEEFRLTAKGIADTVAAMKGGRIPSQQDRFDRFVPNLEEVWGPVVAPGQLVVGEVDVGNLMRLWIKVSDHFSWRLEIQLFVVNSGIVAYGALCWGNKREYMWQIEQQASPDGLREVARNLAFAVYSTPWIKE